jgi:hypothetical protein
MYRKIVLIAVAALLAVASVPLAVTPAVGQPAGLITGMTEHQVRQALKPGATYAVASGQVVVRAADLVRRPSSATQVLPRAAATPWAACGLFDKKTKLVKNYSRQAVPGYAGRTAHLACGTSDNWGLRHIKKEHLDDWQRKAAYIGEGFTQFADWCFTQTLSHPSSKTHRASNDTFQYATPIQIKNTKGQVLNTFTSHVSVARVTQNIITAYPQS